jgi:hypothetical protein
MHATGQTEANSCIIYRLLFSIIFLFYEITKKKHKGASRVIMGKYGRRRIGTTSSVMIRQKSVLL